MAMSWRQIRKKAQVERWRCGCCEGLMYYFFSVNELGYCSVCYSIWRRENGDSPGRGNLNTRHNRDAFADEKGIG